MNNEHVGEAVEGHDLAIKFIAQSGLDWEQASHCKLLTAPTNLTLHSSELSNFFIIEFDLISSTSPFPQCCSYLLIILTILLLQGQRKQYILIVTLLSALISKLNFTYFAAGKFA